MSTYREKIEEIVKEKIRRYKENPSEEVSIDLNLNEKVQEFKKMITENIIPLVRKTNSVIGFAGCSLQWYTNESAEIMDPNKRIFIQILFYPKGHSKITLGVNVPFFQLSYSPAKRNIKITQKTSVKSDDPTYKLAEVEIDKLAYDRIEDYFTEFLRAAILTD
ncbi:MAG: hypothetical protein OZ913_05940 [Ignavibacteriaceae bacterium]|nr:hypothetical protein [Ignavibacteriaceae bacterium]